MKYHNYTIIDVKDEQLKIINTSKLLSAHKSLSGILLYLYLLISASHM